jgi:cell division protein FtsQ
MSAKVEQINRVTTTITTTAEEQFPHLLLRIVKYGILMVIITGVCVVLFLQAHAWMKRSTYFVLKKISVQGNYMLTRKEIASSLKLPENPHLFNIALGDLERQIASHPWIRNVKIGRDFPSTLKITVEERIPVAMIFGKETMLVDEEGMLLSPSENIRVYDVPCITGISYAKAKPGDRIEDRDFQNTLAMLKNLRSLDIGLWFKISEIQWEKGSSFLINLYDQALPVRIPKKGSLERRLYILNQFLRYMNTKDMFQEIALIDLTYDDLVITKNKRNER